MVSTHPIAEKSNPNTIIENTFSVINQSFAGPISSITVMGQTIVIINDTKIALELLGKRSALYSSRPNLVFASEMSVLDN